MRFQSLDWQWYHDENNMYTIQIYGKTDENKSICIKVINFKPFFYIQIDDEWSTNEIDKCIREIKNALYKYIKNKYIFNKMNRTNKETSLTEYDVNKIKLEFEKNKMGFTHYEIIYKYDVKGYTNNKKNKYLKLYFNNYYSFLTFSKVLKKKISLFGNMYKFKLYESDVDQIIRFMHDRNITSCEWLEIDDELYEINDDDISKCDINIKTDYTYINKYECDDMCKFIIASLDIECKSEGGEFPIPERDPIIQIGITYSYYGQMECFYKYMAALYKTDDINGVKLEYFDTEEQVIEAAINHIINMGADILIGYNIFKFDDNYIYQRSKKLKIDKKILELFTKMYSTCAKFKNHKLSTSARGDNEFNYYHSPGIIKIDLMNIVQTNYKLQSYKLDSVAKEFITEKIIGIEKCTHDNKLCTKIYTSTECLGDEFYIVIKYNNGLFDVYYENGKKFKILKIYNDSIILDEYLGDDIDNIKNEKLYWSLVKDDINPNNIGKMFNGSSYERSIIAKYCIQDCALCNILIEKLQILTNYIGMANVCYVPLSYLFIRGQTIKAYSLFLKKCLSLDYVIPLAKKKNMIAGNELKTANDQQNITGITETSVLKKMNENTENNNSDDSDDDDDDNNGYKGAIVIDPIIGFYKDPIIVLDYSSLYPSCMIEYNMSHETLITDTKYLECVESNDNIYTKNTYYLDKTNKKIETSFVQNKENKMGIIPQILRELLNARKNTKKKMNNTADLFKKSILNGLQLAFKITANSIYGQTGASLSPLYCKKIAGSTTSVGRDKLYYAKKFIDEYLFRLSKYMQKCNKNNFRNLMLDIIEDFELPNLDNKYSRIYKDYDNIDLFIDDIYDRMKKILSQHEINPNIIYGDTDSIFFSLNLKNAELSEFDKRVLSIDVGNFVSFFMNYILPFPHVIEYEKIYHPFLILNKKKYVGNLYEDDPNKYYQKSMGIVLIRRDNAQIVKIVCGGIIKELLNNDKKDDAIAYTIKMLNNIVEGYFGIDKFIITKTLKANYKNRDNHAHVVLADRIKKRDPGNAPQLNDRIPYVYIKTSGKINLQGDRVEDPLYIVSNKLLIDYLFYITNQIMNPSMQILQFICDNPKNIFIPFIRDEQNKRQNIKPLTHYFVSPKDNDDKLSNIQRSIIINSHCNIENSSDFTNYNNRSQLIQPKVKNKKKKSDPDSNKKQNSITKYFCK